MTASLRGQVWVMAPGRVFITDYRDYSQVLAEARVLEPTAIVRAVSEDEVPEDAIRIV